MLSYLDSDQAGPLDSAYVVKALALIKRLQREEYAWPEGDAPPATLTGAAPAPTIMPSDAAAG